MSEENLNVDEKVKVKASHVKAEEAHVKLEESRPRVKVEEGPALTLQEPPLDGRGPWIQYNGIATLRIMDSAAWRSAGVNSDKYIEWNYLNNMRVPASYFTDDEISYLLGRDGRFSKVD